MIVLSLLARFGCIEPFEHLSDCKKWWRWIGCSNLHGKVQVVPVAAALLELGVAAAFSKLAQNAVSWFSGRSIFRKLQFVQQLAAELQQLQSSCAEVEVHLLSLPRVVRKVQTQLRDRGGCWHLKFDPDFCINCPKMKWEFRLFSRTSGSNIFWSISLREHKNSVDIL